MNRLLTRFGTAVLVLLAAAASPIRADYLNWTYTSNPNVPGIAVNATATTGGASVSLTNFNTPQAGNTSIPVIAYVTNTSATTPVVFGPTSDVPTSYNLALTITDKTTGDSGTLNFTGTLNGALTATTSSVVASFTPVTSNSLTLDGHTYTVTIPPTTLAAPTSPQQDIRASVSVSNGGGTTGGSTPEPTRLVLGSLGFSCFGLGCWWKRLRRRPEQLPEAA
jgi:hypothetical protein